MTNDTSKYTNHTKEEIEEYLKIVKKSVNAGKFIVCTTEKNEKNRRFIFEYGLGLYWESAQVALRRIPKEVAEVLCLHVFSVNDNGEVKYFTPSKFGTEYSREYFFN